MGSAARALPLAVVSVPSVCARPARPGRGGDPGRAGTEPRHGPTPGPVRCHRDGGGEIGSYRGFALTWKCLLSESTTDKDRKKAKMLDSLLGMVQRFPYADPTHGQLHEDLDRIRGKFKQVCSLLSVQPDFHVSPGGSALSF
ncbi:protein LTO1 homolog isoform X1 [Antechinus flavipes]|uniref:protein LTO1 homolog isoform X1 n=1 Tax=Antechinus flavipes TaxID=38775 RepID=UPI002236B6CF|nr:protein LTO1 homolog isoform X1 [Antechinus flavipes]